MINWRCPHLLPCIFSATSVPSLKRFHLRQDEHAILMKSAIRTAIWALAISAAVSLPVFPQSGSVPPDVKTFAAQYVAAFNSGDPAQLESLYLPQSRACITPATSDVYDFVLTKQMRDPVPPGYILSFAPVNEGNLKALAGQEYFPVKPERELHIDYQYPGTDDGGLLVIWLVHQNGLWVGDFPCMTAHGLQDFRANAAAREKYKALAEAIRDPLRSQLLTMLRAHQTGEAETRYRQATGSDMRTSVLVIDALKDQLQ